MTTHESVIEIGSTGVRLLVAEFTDDRKQNILDRSDMPLAIGRDVFTNGVISGLRCHTAYRERSQHPFLLSKPK